MGQNAGVRTPRVRRSCWRCDIGFWTVLTGLTGLTTGASSRILRPSRVCKTILGDQQVTWMFSKLNSQRREHRLLPIYWPAGPQTVKTNQRSISLPKLSVRLHFGDKKTREAFWIRGLEFKPWSRCSYFFLLASSSSSSRKPLISGLPPSMATASFCVLIASARLPNPYWR